MTLTPYSLRDAKVCPSTGDITGDPIAVALYILAAESAHRGESSGSGIALWQSMREIARHYLIGVHGLTVADALHLAKVECDELIAEAIERRDRKPVPMDPADSRVPGYTVTARWDDETGTWTPAGQQPAAQAKAACWCEYVDIGIGDQRVTDHPECPVHADEQPSGGEA